jgi:lysophospholipase L1-like esterase
MSFAMLGLAHISIGQPFANEIAAFKKQDSLKMPERGAVLFVGSSSISLWKDLEQRFPKKNIINRGFGGSSLPDLKRYLPDIVYPYEPSKIVMYCGENDFGGPGADTIKAETVYQRFVDVYQSIRVKYPLVPVIYISMKPSPSRRPYLPKIAKANELIQQYLRSMPHAHFVDVYTKMLDKNGNPMPDVFLSDSLHMNAKGYDIWHKALKRYL